MLVSDLKFALSFYENVHFLQNPHLCARTFSLDKFSAESYVFRLKKHPPLLIYDSANP